jgi:hypothetical protein
MKKVMFAILRWFMKTKTWEWLSGRVLNHIRVRIWGEPGFSLDCDLLDLWRAVGDWYAAGNHGVVAFACADHSALTSKLVRFVTGGKYSHAGMLAYSDNFADFYAIHMMAPGMLHEHAAQALRHEDAVVAVAFPMTATEEELAGGRMRVFLAHRETLRYDFEQRLDGDSRLYCSELVYRVLEGLVPLKPSHVADREAFSPDDVAACGKVIYERKAKP